MVSKHFVEEAVEDFGDQLSKPRITPKEAGNIIGIGERRIRQLVDEGSLEGYHGGTSRKLWIMSVSVVAYLYDKMDHIERSLRKYFVGKLLETKGLLKF